MKALWKRLLNSIAVRISLSIVLVVAATTVTVAYLLLREEKHLLELELQKKGEYLAKIISQQMIEPLLYEERFAIYSLFQSAIFAEKGIIVFGEVYGLRGEPIVKVHDEKFNPPSVDKTIFLESRSTIILKDNPALQIYDISIPIVTKELGTVGYLRLGITKKFLIEALEDIKKKIYLLSSFIVFCGIMIGLWMARKIIRPVLILNEGVKRVGSGELGTEVEVIGEGEIKELSLAFNEMSRKLKKSIDAIKAAQENLIRTEKLYALGEFSAGLAHEIKNPLTSIKMLMQAAKEKENALCTKDIEIIEGEINRIDRIVQEFLVFARPARADFIITDINALLQEVITLSKPKMEQSNINLIEELDFNIPKVKAHPDGLRQVFLNIVLNAVQAMEHGGLLKVSSFAEDGTLSVCITDTGSGIPDQNLNRIFDPFFTTKEDGTGMGLALVYNIVNEHGGQIKLDTAIGRGTKISILLPI